MNTLSQQLNCEQFNKSSLRGLLLFCNQCTGEAELTNAYKLLRASPVEGDDDAQNRLISLLATSSW